MIQNFNKKFECVDYELTKTLDTITLTIWQVSCFDKLTSNIGITYLAKSVDGSKTASLIIVINGYKERLAKDAPIIENICLSMNRELDLMSNSETDEGQLTYTFHFKHEKESD